MNEVVVSFLMLSGSLFILIAGIGIVRFPESLCQAHPLSKVVTLGISLLLIATAVSLWDCITTLKILLIILFNFATVPLAGHIFACYVVRHEEKSGES